MPEKSISRSLVFPLALLMVIGSLVHNGFGQKSLGDSRQQYLRAGNVPIGNGCLPEELAMATPGQEAMIAREAKGIRFQFFPVFAYRERPSRKESLPEGTTKIANRELRGVLDELAKLWKFRYFESDYPSFLTVREGAESNSFQVVSKLALLNLKIAHPEIRGDKVGDRRIYVKQIRLDMTSNFTTWTPIDSQDLIFRENGYLVVGVGGTYYGRADAIILVVSAEIR